MARSQGEVDRSNGSETLIRSVIAFLLHLLLGAVAVAVLYWLTANFEDASETLRASVGTAEDAEASVLAYLAEARSSLFGWAIGSMAASWLASTLFIAIAQRHEPRFDREAKQKFGIWG